MKRIKGYEDLLINIAAIAGITLLVIAGLVVLALVPATRDNINLVVGLGVTAIGSFARRLPAPAIVATLSGGD